ncbi:MAG: cupin-like domain-containing protein [Pirellulaceae bacterium]
MNSIARVSRPTREQFEREFVAQNRPAVLTDTLQDWTALQKWTPEYLKSQLGDHRLSVAVAEDGRFRYGPDGHPLHHQQFLDAAAFLDHASGAAPLDQSVRYAQSVSLPREFPRLKGDVVPPVYIEGILRSTLMWFGQHGATTCLHYDRMHNLMAMVRGRKRFLIFAPEDLPYLYHCDLQAYGPSVYFSLVDPEHPDEERFPEFRNATPLEVELNAGDMLYLPAFWWHHVNSYEFNIAVNYWWLPFPREVLDQMNEGIRSLGAAFPRLPPHWQRYVSLVCGHFFRAVGEPTGTAGATGPDR